MTVAGGLFHSGFVSQLFNRRGLRQAPIGETSVGFALLNRGWWYDNCKIIKPLILLVKINGAEGGWIRAQNHHVLKNHPVYCTVQI